MATLILNKIPSDLKIKTSSIDFDIFFDIFTEYIEDLEDRSIVTEAMKNDKIGISLDDFVSKYGK